MPEIIDLKRCTDLSTGCVDLVPGGRVHMSMAWASSGQPAAAHWPVGVMAYTQWVAAGRGET